MFDTLFKYASSEYLLRASPTLCSLHTMEQCFVIDKTNNLLCQSLYIAWRNKRAVLIGDNIRQVIVVSSNNNIATPHRLYYGKRKAFVRYQE